MSRRLSSEEQQQLYHRYRKSDLFRQWSPILCQLECEQQELDVVTIWWETEKLLQQLRQEQEARDEMIPYLFKNLIVELKTIEQDGKTTLIRTDEQTELSAVTVMCVLMSRLMNAVEEGHEDEDFDNLPMCIAIANILRSHPHFQVLEERFFKRKLGNDGKKIVITPSDPMRLDNLVEDMDETARKEVEETKHRILELTKGLKAYFGDLWSDWESLIIKVCMDIPLLHLMKQVTPSNNDWKMNQKMICNLVGIFRQKKEIAASVNGLNKALSNKQLSSYLRNHADYGGNDSCLTKEQHKQIEGFIESVSA